MEHDDEGNSQNETDKSLWERYTADIDKIGPANVARRDNHVDEGIHVSVSKRADPQCKAQKDKVFGEGLEEFGVI